MNTIHKRLLGVTAAAASLGLVGASTASAQPIDQDGLVNVAITDVNVQAPIAVAANLCNVSVNVIATQYNGGPTTCEAFATSEASNNAGGRGGRVNQQGLVNLALTDLNIQVPVSAALNLCDISANVLALQVDLGQQTSCTATAETIASRGA